MNIFYSIFVLGPVSGLHTVFSWTDRRVVWHWNHIGESLDILENIIRENNCWKRCGSNSMVLCHLSMLWIPAPWSQVNPRIFAVMAAAPPTACEQCKQLFGSFDSYLLPQEVSLRCARYAKNKTTGARDIPAMNECYPCEDREGNGGNLRFIWQNLRIFLKATVMVWFSARRRGRRTLAGFHVKSFWPWGVSIQILVPWNFCWSQVFLEIIHQYFSFEL